MSQCPHAYWHASQCPFCEIDRLRREMRSMAALADALQLQHDRAVGELKRRDRARRAKRGGRRRRAEP